MQLVHSIVSVMKCIFWINWVGLRRKLTIDIFSDFFITEIEIINKSQQNSVAQNVLVITDVLYYI